MNAARFVECLAMDYARLREIASLDLAAAVPSCPGWTVADLTRHVAQVYLHKVFAMREGTEPQAWPPPDTEHAEPLALLARAYAELTNEFASRKPEDPAGGWYKPDQTVGFWIRRMAQETVIHRIDAELGTRQRLAAVADDLAVDGIDELLNVFVAYSVATWGSYFTQILQPSRGWSYLVRTDAAAWHVRTGPDTFIVDEPAGRHRQADISISGPPMDVLRWVWNRDGFGQPGNVVVEGPAEAVDELKRCIAVATQ